MKIKNILLGFVLIAALTPIAASCSSDDDANKEAAEGYGFVQFKLVKNGSLSETTRSSDADQIDSLNLAKKLRVTLKSTDEDIIQQTLLLSAANNGSETEMGLWSEKCQLMSGEYNLVGYELLDNLDSVILTYDQPSPDAFEVVSGGLCVETLGVNVKQRGTVTFQITKDLSNITRASGYRLDAVTKVDVGIKNSLTGEVATYYDIPTEIVYYYESETDRTLHSKLVCQTPVAVKAGDYTAITLSLYEDETLLEASEIEAENSFTVSDCSADTVDVPLTMLETVPVIHDGIILKKIWDALDGPNWSYRGPYYNKGANWDFSRDVDLWTAQPGVQVYDNGQVATLSLGLFGAKGDMPEELGELSELRSLILGNHSDGLGASPIDEAKTGEEIIQAFRKDLKDITTVPSLASMAPEMWETFPDSVQNELQEYSERKSTYSLQSLHTLSSSGSSNYSTGITSLPKSIGNLKNLTSLFIANCPIDSIPDEISGLESCTDVEIYNCPNLKEIPKGLMNMPKLQLVNFSENRGISSDTMYEGLKEWTGSASATSVQGLYFMYDNIKVIPDLRSFTKLSLLQASHNQIEKFEAPFNPDRIMSIIDVSYNNLSDLPRNSNGTFAGYAAAETWNFSNNKFTQFPDIFPDDYQISTINFSFNEITGFENGDDFHGVIAEILNLNYNRMTKFYRCFYNSGSWANYLQLNNNGITEFEDSCFIGKYTYGTQALDLSSNRLTTLPNTFTGRFLPYLTGLDLSSNAFSSFPYMPLNISGLLTYLVRAQRDDNGYRCLQEWPTGIARTNLSALYLGSNDIRKVTDGSLTSIRFFIELTDNPNISIDLTDCCPYIQLGMMSFLFDPGQDVRGCDYVFGN